MAVPSPNHPTEFAAPNSTNHRIERFSHFRLLPSPFDKLRTSPFAFCLLTCQKPWARPHRPTPTPLLAHGPPPGRGHLSMGRLAFSVQRSGIRGDNEWATSFDEDKQYRQFLRCRKLASVGSSLKADSRRLCIGCSLMADFYSPIACRCRILSCRLSSAFTLRLCSGK
jgi:hypothetical protein